MEKKYGLQAMKLTLTMFLLVLLSTSLSYGNIQGNQEKQLLETKVSVKSGTIASVFDQIIKQHGVEFFYNTNIFDAKRRITIAKNNPTIKEVLLIALGDKFTYTVKGKHIMIAEKKASNASAQQSSKVEVTGRVVDSKGVPLAGVNVVIYGTQTGTVTNVDGRYSIHMDPEGVLSASFIGFKTDIIPIKGKSTVNFTMESSSTEIEEVAVVAFGTQKKESVVSAITTIRPMDLKTTSSDFTSGLTGKIAGITGWQTGGVPGAMTEEEMNTKFYIRGITSFNSKANTDPLILIDGVESSKLELSRMVPEDIETFSVMKDASATAMYGARGANGVILITTKKGEAGSVYTSVRYEVVMSEPTKNIDVVDPITYMRMYNRALIGRSQSATPKYSVERINRTMSGKYPSWVYPANDWYKQLFKNQSYNHRAGLSIRGGSDVVQYYASVNYNRDEGMLKSDRLNEFKTNIESNQFSYTTNLNIDLKAGIKLIINSKATLDKYNGPLGSQQSAYFNAFNASPVDFAPTYPGDEEYQWEHIRFGGTLGGVNQNPYKEIQKGYKQQTRYSSTNRAEYQHNLSSLIKGLEIRLSASLQQEGLYATHFETQPFTYELANYDFETGIHTLNLISEGDRTLSVTGSPSRSVSQITYGGQAIHTAAWKDHQTSLTAVFQMQEKTESPISQVLEGMPRRNLTFSMRGSYGFKDRYFGELSFGYNGSERFAKNNRFGFFPAGGAAWVVSSEPFMKNTQSWLYYLKLRASYGKVGNDGIVDEPRFVFLPEIIDESSMDPTPSGSSQFSRYLIESYANENIQWEIAEQTNLGLEAKFFKGLFEVNFDVYQEIRHNIIAERLTIPANMGVERKQLDNIGKVRSRGFDFSGKIQHAFSNDFWIILNGTVTYNKAVFKELEEPSFRPEWQSKIGKEISQSVGYIAEGLFRDQEEIDNSPFQGGDVKPGDIRYRDLNNDGIIDQYDCTFIGYPETPRLIYGFSGFINYKNIEFNFAFQGSGKRTFFMDPVQMSPFAGEHAMLTAIYEDHWSDDNMTRRPFWPRLSTDNIAKHNPQENWGANETDIYKSTYFMREASFLRCTALEVAYNIPKKLVNSWGLQNIRVSMKANNLFSISDFKVWDVELGSSGFNYPIQRTYSVGVNVSF